ncbi:CBS domain-containing protein [Halalkalibacter urbisdiaboli]|uniref:CBS domain-containing protein n=1 Tax=Halalkalibacter urbisdiaboli TaxID=1960589 RepID=UPI000B435CD8|nr:CBS domain-containing protein [Halalkalibacter urbisdiaboli]
MRYVLSHVNIDFDGFASLYAATLLYPKSIMVMPDTQHPTVRQYLSIYRDHFTYISIKDINWENVEELILVDVANPKRVGLPSSLPEHIHISVYDHHPPDENNIKANKQQIEQVGATITLLLEQLISQGYAPTEIEATLFGLGLYTDTGSFAFSHTTSRDLEVASFLLKNGMNLELVNRFSEQLLLNQEQQILQSLLRNIETFKMDGQVIGLTRFEQVTYLGGLASLTHKAIDAANVDGLVSIVKMGQHVYVIARSQSERVNVRTLITQLGGNGHEKAASATIKKSEIAPVYTKVKALLQTMIRSAITAQLFMVSPVKTVSTQLTINEVAEKMFQYGHTGFPVVDEHEKVVGIISRRDIDKASHHQLGHAPVKAFMTEKPITLSPSATLEEIQETMIQYNIGRVPIVSEEQLVGIISRTDVIEILHNKNHRNSLINSAITVQKHNVSEHLIQQLDKNLFHLLKQIGQEADIKNVQAFLVGGIVRDLLLERTNEDIDLVIEGDGIAFAHHLHQKYGGSLKEHDTFGTASWTTNSGEKLDIVSCRTEYYALPASLPTVKLSNLKEDLARRDFTINAMAIKLNTTSFGVLVDLYQGMEDLVKREIRILHNLSFIEDPTRIFRAARFAARFRYHLAAQTEKLARSSVSYLSKLSINRIIHELELVFKESSFIQAVYILQELTVFEHLLKTKTENIQIIQLEQITTIHKAVDYFDWFAFLTSLIFKEDNWKQELTKYAIKSTHQTFLEELERLVTYFKETEAKNITFGSFHQNMKQVSYRALLFFSNFTEATCFIRNYLERRKDVKPFLNGHDLKQFGIPQGPIYSTCLLELECLMLDDKITSFEEAKEWAIQKYL